MFLNENELGVSYYKLHEDETYEGGFEIFQYNESLNL